MQLRFAGLPGLYPFQQFASVLDRPDIIKAQLAPSAALPPAPALLPPPTLDVALPNGRGTGDADQISLTVTARASAPLAHLRLYADGRLLEDEALSGFESERKIGVGAAAQRTVADSASLRCEGPRL